jgi:hypothetical protein
VETLITIFREVRDPRDFNARHDLAGMLFIALAATLCGAKSCVEIADFAAANEDALAEIVALPHGPPSHDSFSRVFRLLDPEEMAGLFARFKDGLREALGLGPARGVVAVDGKSLRRAYERGRAFMPPLMVSVWDAETRLSLASRHAPGGDEVAATLAALKAVTLKGCTVTADALHCHPAMAEAVRARGGHYALRLKGNHRPLYARERTRPPRTTEGECDRRPIRRAGLPRPRRLRPHRDRANGQGQSRGEGSLHRALQASVANAPARNNANPLERRKPVALAPRRRLS